MTVPTILEAIADPNLLGAWLGNKPSWRPWYAFLAAQFALHADKQQRRLFEQCTGRRKFPQTRARETFIICGRRAGKTSIFAVIAVYLAAFEDWSQYLAHGERGHILLLATDQAQARQSLTFIRAILNASPYLKSLVEHENNDAIDLINGIRIQVKTASFRSTRGYTVVAALLDEAAFLPSGSSANPDTEILNALRPAMLTIPGAMLICVSSPYEKRGALYDIFCRHYGREDARTLVWKAPTLTMNPSANKSEIDAAYVDDPMRARSEYGAEFRPDGAKAFIAKEAVDACIETGCYERPPSSLFTYWAFVDPSGGRHDPMTLAICHLESDTVVIDCLREYVPNFSPDAAIADFAQVVRSYSTHEVVGDRYSGNFAVDRFADYGIRYEASSRTKSQLYLDLLPRVNSGQIVLLDNDTLFHQLLSLERKVGKGRDAVDHPPGQHDDLANAVAGVASLAQKPIQMFL